MPDGIESCYTDGMIQEKAYAKLNISLDVSRPRDDGYHDMRMIMQSVTLCDDISLEITESGKVFARTSLPYIPGDERNLAVKAARLFLEQTGNAGKGVAITIEKNIPVGAGMAGGSSDAAAVLRALNKAFGTPLDGAQLCSIAERVGSDVAFCVLGGTALAEGRGEILTQLSPFPACRIVIAKPEFSVSTPELFRALDAVRLRVHPDTDGIIQALDCGDLVNVCRRMYNVFEDVPDRRMRVVGEIKARLSNAGALGSIMTGTGSAVYGIFEEAADVSSLVSELKKEYGFAVMAKPKEKERIG